MLTWRDGHHEKIMAPTSGAAIDIANRGWPSTITRIDQECEYFKLMEAIVDIKDKLKIIFDELGLKDIINW